MRRSIKIATAIILALGLGLEGYGLSSRVPPAADVTARPSTVTTNEKGVELAKTGFAINVAQMLGELDELRPDERADQIADWAVYGTLMESGLSNEAIRAATYDNSPFRTPALEDVLDYAYGAGRRVFLPDGAVWLFYSERDKDRTATLARLADQVRMEQGAFPRTASVFRYRSDLAAGAIHVTREADVTSRQLFSSEFGYIERSVTTLEDLTRWLNSIDDVTHVARLNKREIELGGRRIANTRTDGIAVDDLAALYQAHKMLAMEWKEVFERDGNPSVAGEFPPSEPGFSLDPTWDFGGLANDLQQLDLYPADFIRSTIGVANEATDKPDNSSASPRLVSTARDVEQFFRFSDLNAYRIPPDIQRQFAPLTQFYRDKRKREADREAIVPFLELQESLKEKQGLDADRVGVLLKHIKSRNQFQCARYDGPLQGTRVGMILFYTDALAKLWASVDHHHEAPVHQVHGFLSEPIEGPFLEPLYWGETWRLPNTRLWFGLKREAYEGVPEHGEGLNFAHIATRVYSAGSNPLHPGKEIKAAEPSRRVFNWWDRHFGKVADYEQAYHTQNQIMKWSVITGWMAEHDFVPGLNDVAVNHSHHFDQWYAQSDQLRFRKDIPSVSKERWPKGNECLEIIRSYLFHTAGSPETYIEGGVSLGSSTSLEPTSRIGDSLPVQLRRGSIKYEQSTPDRLTTVKDTQFTFPAPDNTAARVVATISDQARVRNGPSELRITTLTVQVSLEGNTRSIALISDQGSLGTLHSEGTVGGVRLSWRDGVVAGDEALVRALAKSHDLASIRNAVSAYSKLLTMRNLYVVDRENQGLQIIRMGGGNDKGPIDPGSTSDGLRSSGDSQPRLFTVVDGRSDSYSQAYLRFSDSPNWLLAALQGFNGLLKAQATILEDQHAIQIVNGTKWQILWPLTDESEVGLSEVGRVFTDRGPNRDARFVQIVTGDPTLGEVKGYVQQGVLYLERPTDAGLYPAFNDFVTIQSVDREYISSVEEAIRNGYTSHAVRSVGEIAGMRAASFARDGRFEEAATALMAVSQKGNLREAVASYKQHFPKELLAEFANGPDLQFIERLVRETENQKNPDWGLLQAITSLRADNLAVTTEALHTAVFRGAKPSNHALHMADEAFRKHGASAASDFLNVKSDQVKGLFKNIAALVTIGGVGYRLHTELPTSAFSGSRVYSRAEQPDLAARFHKELPPEVYVEDGAFLNKHDWDAEPGPSFSKIVDDPDVMWEELGTEGLGDFLPSVIIKNNTRYTRRNIPKDHPRDIPKDHTVNLAATSLGVWPVSSVLLARSCDANNDGAVTGEERTACKRN